MGWISMKVSDEVDEERTEVGVATQWLIVEKKRVKDELWLV